MRHSSTVIAAAIFTLIQLQVFPIKGLCFTSVVKVVRASSSEIVIQSISGKKYRLKPSLLNCDTLSLIAKGQKALFYSGGPSFESDPYVISLSLNGNSAIFALDTGSSLAPPNGKCEISDSSRYIEDLRGCCSNHGGVKQCLGGGVICNDFTTSPTCECN